MSEKVISTDEEAQRKYRDLLISVGFKPEIARGISEDVFGAVREAQAELRKPNWPDGFDPPGEPHQPSPDDSNGPAGDWYPGRELE